MTRSRRRAARAPRRALLVALALLAVATLAPSPGRADWQADHVDWTYPRTGEFDYYYPPSSPEPYYHKQITTYDGEAWVTLTAWARVDEWARPIRVNQSVSAVSALWADLHVSGGPPPGGTYPPVWPQRSYIEGERWLRIEEIKPFPHSYEAIAFSEVGVPCPNCSPKVCVPYSLSSDGTDPIKRARGKPYAEEPIWYYRPLQTPYPAAYIMVTASIDLQGEPPGGVVINAETWALRWGIFTKLGALQIEWPAP